MVQNALTMLADALATLAGLALPLFYLLIAVVVLLVLVGIFDRPRLIAGFDALGPRLRPALAWIGVAFVLALAIFVLRVVEAASIQHLSDVQNAQTSGGVDSDSTATIQAPPTATLSTVRTFRRTVTLPRVFGSQLTPEGLGVIAPYLGVPPGADIKSLRDEFHRSGADIVFSRQQTVEQQDPIRLDASDVHVSIDMTSPLFGSGRSYFHATFRGAYTLHNPTNHRAHISIAFPLPTGSGTLSDIVFRVNGQAIDVADLAGGYVWNGDVAASAPLAFDITYKNQGSRGWTYRLSSRREPVDALSLTLDSNRRPSFARYTIFPSSTSFGFGTTTLKWDLKHLVTAQDIGIVFSSSDTRESVAKMVTYAPVVPFVVLAALAVFAIRTGRRIGSAGTAVTLAGTALGVALAAVLTWYLPSLLAAIVGCAVAVAIAARTLGVAYLRPLAIALMTPIAFLLTPNTSLVLVLLALVSLWLLVLEPAGNPLPRFRRPADG